MKVGFGFYWGDMEPEDFAEVVQRGEALGLRLHEHLGPPLVYPKTIAHPERDSQQGHAPFSDPRRSIRS